MKKYKNYKIGKPITSLDELAKQEFMFFFGTLYHKGWFMSWQMRHIYMWLKNGQIKYAIKVEDKNET